MCSRSLLLATLAVASLLASCTAVVDVPAPRVTLNSSSSTCVPPPMAMGVGERENITFRCQAPRGSVVWLIGDYALVDRDQFKADTYGVLVEDGPSNNSRLTLYPDGADFLRDWFVTSTFNISCQTVVQEVNVNRSEDSLTIFVGFSVLQQPAWEVIFCHDNGSYTLTITYQPPNMSCVNGVINYALSLSDGNCSNVPFGANVPLTAPLTAQCNVKNTGGLTATLVAKSGDFNRTLTTSLTNVTCNQATWMICNESNEMFSVLENFRPSSGDWGVIPVRGEEVCVFDRTPGPGSERSGQCHVAQREEFCNVTTPTPSVTDETSILEDPGALAGIGVAAFVVPFIATALIGLLIGYCCFREDKGKKPRRLPDDKSAPTSHDDKSYPM